jgi:acyl carrier protein phosphodiesterase
LNYLAHAYLSCSNEDILFGNFIGDSVNSKTDDVYSNAILEGIRLHRKIDDFTDKHPLVRKAVKIFRPSQSKYAPVVTDILWDHTLSKYWDRYSGESLRDFIDGVYKSIALRKEIMPSRLSSKIDKMLEGDFLFRYQTLAGLTTSFGYMDRRTRFDSNFVGATEVYQSNENEIDELFLEFFPDLIAFVDEACDC